MRRLSACLAVLVLAALLPASALSQDAGLRAGFRGLAWGAPVADLPGAMLARAGGVMDYYTRDGEDLVFVGVPLHAIRYGFLRGRLGYVGLVYADPDKTRTLAQYLTMELGAPRTDPAGGTMTFEAAQVTVQLGFDTAQSLGFVHIFHRPAMDAIGAGLPPGK